jgi:glyoxylase I family protein
MQSSRASPAVTVEGIEHVVLLVNGLERALSFYEAVLGARVESRFPKYAMVELRVGVSHIDLVDTSVAEGGWALPPVAGGRNVDHIGLRVAAPDAEAGPTPSGRLRCGNR